MRISILFPLLFASVLVAQPITPTSLIATPGMEITVRYLVLHTIQKVLLK